MEIPTKVTIEITATGWAERVFAGSKVVSERAHYMTGRGSSKATTGGDVYDDLPEFDELANAVDDLCFGPFGIAQALMSIEESADC